MRVRRFPPGLRCAVERRYRLRGRRLPLGAAIELTEREHLMVALYRQLERMISMRKRGDRPPAWFFDELLRRRAEREAERAAMTQAERDEADAQDKRMSNRERSHRRTQRMRDNGDQAPYTLASTYERDGGTCAWCLGLVDLGVRAPDPRAPQLDHLTPVAEGGVDHPDNIALVHAFCNNSRGVELIVPPEFARYWLDQRVKRGPRSVSYSSLTQDHITAWEDGRDWARDQLSSSVNRLSSH